MTTLNDFKALRASVLDAGGQQILRAQKISFKRYSIYRNKTLHYITRLKIKLTPSLLVQ